MRPRSVLIKSFATQASPVLLRVWQPLEDGLVALFHESVVTPEDGGFLSAEVDGLRPGEWFEYAFFSIDADEAPVSRGLIGRVRTALADGVLEPLTVAMSACNGGGNAPWPQLLTTAGQYYDVFCHLGDMAYNDGAVTLAEYRDKWAPYMSGEGFREAYAQAGLYAAWDDHEFDNDWNPETMSPDQIAAAKQAFFESIAAERASDGTSWFSYRWGDTAEFFVLDCRSERKPSGRDTADAEYVSAAQLEWLIQGLNSSAAHFKIILNSVPITNMPFVWDFADSDRWEGYAAQRDALLQAIDDLDIPNVWFLSGDFHVCFVSTLEPDPTTRSGRVHEIAVTGGNTNLLGDTLGGDQFPYATSQPRAVTLRFDPVEDNVLVRFIDPDNGSVSWESTLQGS